MVWAITVGWLSHSIAKVVFERVEAFTAPGRKSGTDGELVSLETLAQIVVTWLSQNYFPLS